MAAFDRWWPVVLAMAFLVSPPALAGAARPAAKPEACSEKVMESVAGRFGIERYGYVKDGGVLVAGACKRWPGDEHIQLAALIYEGDRDREKMLAVAMVDDKTGKVISSHRGTVEEDGGVTAKEDSVRLDTARYDLAPGVRAFGVDIDYTVRVSCAQGGAGPARTLYVRDGKALRPVLDDFTTSYWSFDDPDYSSCSAPRENAPDPLVENIDVTLAVDKTATSNGYADLLVTAVSSYENNRKKSTRPPFHYRLRYDGKKYATKAMQTAFWQWCGLPVK
jgi:hypothetical protein